MDIDVRRIAKLSKLRFSDDEIIALEQQMIKIVAMAENLPQTHGELEANEFTTTIFRKDKVYSECNREELLACAPVKQSGCYVVPKTVKGE